MDYFEGIHMKFMKSRSVFKTLLLFVITGVLLWSFQIHYERFQSDDYPLKAVIIQKAHSSADNPIVAAYRWHRSKHWLIFYTIDQSDSLLFKAFRHTVLDGPVDELMADKESNGVWVKIRDEWRYFNDKLQKEERDEHYRLQYSNESYPFTIDRKENVVEIILDDDHTLYFPIARHEQLQALYPLSGDHSLWLGVFANDLKIITK